MRNRSIGVNIRMTEQEKKRIEMYAKKCGLSVSEYLRQLANGYTPKEIPSDNFFMIAHDLEKLIDFFKGDENFAAYLKGLLSELCDTYLRPIKEENKFEK